MGMPSVKTLLANQWAAEKKVTEFECEKKC